MDTISSVFFPCGVIVPHCIMVHPGEDADTSAQWHTATAAHLRQTADWHQMQAATLQATAVMEARLHELQSPRHLVPPNPWSEPLQQSHRDAHGGAVLPEPELPEPSTWEHQGPEELPQEGAESQEGPESEGDWMPVEEACEQPEQVSPQAGEDAWRPGEQLASHESEQVSPQASTAAAQKKPRGTVGQAVADAGAQHGQKTLMPKASPATKPHAKAKPPARACSPIISGYWKPCKH